MALKVTDHGTQVQTSRLLTAAMSPNAAGNGYNLIFCSYTGAPGVQPEWTVLKNFTDVPTAHTQSTFFTGVHHYPNTNITWNTAFTTQNQIRCPNGRIIFPCADNYFVVYYPDTETIAQFGPFVESPPVDPNASTIPFAYCFSKAGDLFFTTQESQNRPSTLVQVDYTATPPTITVKSSFGTNATGYTTYGFKCVADSDYVYEAYGESSWQLWCTNRSTNVSTLMTYPAGGNIEVPSTGSISFVNVVVGGVSKGFRADIHTNLGQAGDVLTQLWVIGGATYAYTAGVDPPGGLAHDVTPATNPIPNPPDIDYSGGAGVISWRPYGSTGVYTTYNYSVTNTAPVQIESLFPDAAGDGVRGNATQYNGWFRRKQSTLTTEWEGPWTSGIAQPVEANDGTISHLIGYPNTGLYDWTLANAWSPVVAPVNPVSKGAFAVNGTQNAGTKYPVAAVLVPSVGASGRIYECGQRERNGNGSGIGSYDKTTHAFAGVYSSLDGSTGPASMKTVLPTGLLVDTGLGYVVMASALLTPPGDAPLYIFDYTFNAIAQPIVRTGLSNLGQIFPTSTSHVICGVTQSANGKIALYQFNLQTQTLVQYIETPIAGATGSMAAHPVTGSVWLFVGNTLYEVDVDTLQILPLFDASTQGNVGVCSFGSDNKTFWFSGGNPSGIAGAKLYSLAPSTTTTTTQRRLTRRRSYTP